MNSYKVVSREPNQGDDVLVLGDRICKVIRLSGFGAVGIRNANRQVLVFDPADDSRHYVWRDEVEVIEWDN